MPRLRNRLAQALALPAGVLALTGCGTEPAAPPEPAERPMLGLMTSLPLYWAENAQIADLAAGRAAPPWQREVIEQSYTLLLLDTLSPVPALSPDVPDTDPLAGLARLAVIQPRGLSPADNVALDQWVRAGGRLLLVLDPALTGEYAAPLGDPRRPVDNAPIPPVAARWGLAIEFDETQPAAVITTRLGEAELPLALPGTITIADPDAADCTLLGAGAAARCRVGKGQVTLIADAALFEHRELAGEGGTGLVAAMAAALR